MDDLIPTIPFAADGAWPGVTGFCTTRRGGVSGPPYDTFNLGMNAGEREASVSVNRARLRALLPGEPVWLRQVHGIVVHDADRAPDAGRPPAAYSPSASLPDAGPSCAVGGPVASPLEAPQADACVTAQAGRVLAILTADCLPIVIADARCGVLGVAHAGWRGLAGGVIEATVLAMRSKAPGANALQAWIGPGIGPAHFEVGPDVVQAFSQDGVGARALFTPIPGRPGKWLADLPELAALRLRLAGVGKVLRSGRCTVADRDTFYSYRRDGQTGRMATLAWLDGG